MIKELFYLIKLLFTKQSNQLEVVTMKHFPFEGFSAMSWCGKIITRKEDVGTTTKNHERIHLEQALYFKSWVKYYVVYFWWWVKGFSTSAYYTIPFEMEAYGNESDYDYQPTKTSWKKYIINNRSKVYKENQYNWRKYCKSL